MMTTQSKYKGNCNSQNWFFFPRFCFRFKLMQRENKGNTKETQRKYRENWIPKIVFFSRLGGLVQIVMEMQWEYKGNIMKIEFQKCFFFQDSVLLPLSLELIGRQLIGRMGSWCKGNTRQHKGNTKEIAFHTCFFFQGSGIAPSSRKENTQATQR